MTLTDSNKSCYDAMQLDTVFSQKRRRGYRALLILLIALALVTLAVIGVGSSDISCADAARIVWDRIVHSTGVLTPRQAIIINVRIPRILMAVLVGAGLSTAGCALQGLFKNPMASPWVLGVSSGAAFGASVAMLLSVNMLGLEVPLFAFIAAMCTLALVYYLSRVNGRTLTYTLLLIGISIAFFFSAMVSIVQYIAGDELRGITVWLMGTLTQSTWKHVAIITPFILSGITVIYLRSRRLNILSLDETTAMDLGIDVEKVKRVVMIATAVLTGAAVSFTGPIGFVGLIIPHIVRNIIGPDYRILLPASCLAGALFLIGADTLARMTMNEIPVGIITAVFGCPFFIYLARRKRQTRISI